MARLKIVHIINDLESGGAQRHLLELLRHSDRKKFTHQVIVIKQAGFFENEFRKTGWEIFVLNKRLKANPFFIFKVYFLLKKLKPDLVMTHLFGGHLYGRPAAKLARVAKVCAREDLVHLENSALRNAVKAILGIWVDRVIAISGEVKDWLVSKEKIPGRKIEVIHNGIDLERFKIRAEEEEKLKKKAKIVIGDVATHKKQKGLEYLIKAFDQVLKEYPRAELWLVGGSRESLQQDEGQALKDLTAKLGLKDKIIFWGDRKDVPRLLRQMDLFVFPSLWEGFGIAVLEAWASGLPVIASRLKCIEEYAQDGENILLVKPAAANELADKMKQLIRDDQLRQQLARNGRQRVSEFDARKVVKRYEQFFQETLEQG